MCYIQGRQYRELLLGVSHLWFLLTIFECYVIGRKMEAFLRWSLKKKIVLVIVCCLWIVVTTRYNLPIRFLTIDRFIHFFPFYFIGMIFSTLSVYKLKNFLSCMAVFSIFLLVLIHYLFDKETIDQAVGILVVLSVFLYMRTKQLKKCPQYIIQLDRHSMGIYILHQIIQQEMNKKPFIHQTMIECYYMYPVVQFAFLIILTYLLSVLIHKWKYGKYLIG